jgi:hypothetical protein
LSRFTALCLALGAILALSLPAAGSSAAKAKQCGTVTPIVPKGSGGGIPKRLRTRVAWGIVECSTANSIIRHYYVTKLTNFVRIESGFSCNGGVEPRALIVCKRKNARVEAET